MTAGNLREYVVARLEAGDHDKLLEGCEWLPQRYQDEILRLASELDIEEEVEEES